MLLKSVYLYQLVLKIDLIRKLLIGTIKSLAFISDLIKVIVFFFFLYGNIALYIYGGAVNSGSSKIFEERFGDELAEPEYLFNFNDYFNTFYTLFMIMMTGHGGYDMYLTLGVPLSWWNNLYFISFFFVTNCIFLSILIGLICESTGAMMNSEDKLGDIEGENEGEGDDTGDDDDKGDKEETGNEGGENKEGNEDINEDMDLYLDLGRNAKNSDGD